MEREPAAKREFRYDAFISYRHVQPDRKWANWLHRSLETFRTPKALVAEGAPARLEKVFRDELELSASSDLAEEIDEALEQSRYLIVVCSPRTPESKWVNQEIIRFREMERADQVLALLVEGQPAKAFPPALLEVRHSVSDEQGWKQQELESVEPLAADVRTPHSEGGRYRRRMALLRLLAPLLGCDLDDLIQRDRRRRRKRAAVLSIAAVILIGVLTGLTLWALASRAEALRQEREAVNTQFRLDENSSPSPLNLGRRANLKQLLLRARASGSTDLVPKIERLLNKIPRARSRVELLGANPSRVGLAVPNSGNRLFAWSQDQIEQFSPEGGDPTVVYRQKGGRLLWVQGHPTIDGVLLEIDFDHFADPALAARVETCNGRRFLRHVDAHDIEGVIEFKSEVLGNERGLFIASLVEPDGGDLKQVGLSVKLRQIGLAADRSDIVDYIFLARQQEDAKNRNDLVEQKYARMTESIPILQREGYNLRKGILSVLPDRLTARPLAYALGGEAVIYDVVYPGVQKTGFMESAMDYDFILPMVRIGDHLVKLAEPTIFCEDAKFYLKAPAFKQLNMTDERPNYQPAALDMIHRQAVLRDLLVRFSEGAEEVTSTSLGVDWSIVSSVRFTADGQALILRYEDRGAGLYDLQTTRLRHRFPGPNPQVRDVAVAQDGRFVFVLEENGVVTRWDFQAFGPDGWSASDESAGRRLQPEA